MIITVDFDRLAELARLEAERHPPRTRERRAAAALWAALVTTSTASAARSALAGFATAEACADALDLLGRLAAAATATTGEP